LHSIHSMNPAPAPPHLPLQTERIQILVSNIEQMAEQAADPAVTHLVGRCRLLAPCRPPAWVAWH